MTKLIAKLGRSVVRSIAQAARRRRRRRRRLDAGRAELAPKTEKASEGKGRERNEVGRRDGQRRR